MDVKKHLGVDLEKKKKSFLAIGLLFSLAIVLAAFEYRTVELPPHLPMDNPIVDVDIIEIAPISIPKKKIEKIVITNIELIDDVEEEDPIDIETLEIDEASAIDPLAQMDLPEEIIEKEEIPLIYTDEMPEFVGGLLGLMKYLQKNIKYPREAKRANRHGIVHISFVVEKNGDINEVVLERGIGYGCDEESLRVIKQMPNWKPGKQMGKLVRVKFFLPIAFKLR
jgi:protein TonB